MLEIVKTMKLHLINIEKTDSSLFQNLTKQYVEACNFISEYIFDNNFPLSLMQVQDNLYQTIRSKYCLKSQFTISAIKTVIAKYKTVKKEIYKKPYCYYDEKREKKFIKKTLEWLQKPICFKRPQADFVRGRDYSFILNKKTGEMKLSLNTLSKRVYVSFDVPGFFEKYFDGTWSFGTGKLVSLKGEWYLHIPMTKITTLEYINTNVNHVVGVDRGLRFLATTYDETGKTIFIDGKTIIKKRNNFQKIRSELQSKNTKSTKRVLKRISGRENRWMSDINHQISKTLVERYGKNTLFVIEDLKGISFSDDILSNRSKKQRQELRTWSFYQLEQYLIYKSHVIGSEVLKVKPDYTSQRCPKCGRIHKANRHHAIHEYICDKCGYRSNDDRVGAMNLQFLGTLYISGDTDPKITINKEN